MVTSRGSYSGGVPELATPFCRKAELAEIKRHLLNKACRAVFLNSEMGLGTTSLLRELASSTPARSSVLTFHGTPSLSNIPFGVLTPFLTRTTSALVVSHVDAIREILVLLESKNAELRQTLSAGVAIGLPLLIIDEADHIDRATAEVVGRLVQAGQVKAVISHRGTHDLVDPLPQLWDQGLAERISLQPLTMEEGHWFCSEVLGGRVSASTSWYFWSAAGGNPHLMWLIISDAHKNAGLNKTGGVWIAAMESTPRGLELTDVVREQLRGLSANARRALNLVALAEPVDEGIIAEMLGMAPLNELHERRLIQESAAGPGQIQLLNSIYGEVIRGMVPWAESAMLHKQLVEHFQTDDFNPQALLRRVNWALDSGEQVPQDRLLLASIYACKLFQSADALRLAELVTSREYALRVRSVKARAYYNVGDYLTAADYLQGIEEEATNVTELLFGALLHSATRAAIGDSPELSDKDANTLRATGERLALEDPGNAAEIRIQAQERAGVMDILNLSRTGRYRDLGPMIEKTLAIPIRRGDPEYWLNRAVVLAVEAERLSALGHPVQGMASAAQALAIPQSEGHDVFFLPEMILGRVQTASLTAGAWGQVEEILRAVPIYVGPAVVSFGGSTSTAHGMMLLRQGRIGQAHEVLMSGVEALQLSDPLHLLGFCTSMSFYTAAVLGKREVARRLQESYKEGHGMFVVTLHERAYIAAGVAHLKGGGPEELMALAAAAAESELRQVELNALSLALDFDVNSVAPRLRVVAESVEGPWAEGLAAFGRAVEDDAGQAALVAGERLLQSELYHFAAMAFHIAEGRAVRDRLGGTAQSARLGISRCAAVVGAAPSATPETDEKDSKIRNGLTKREREITGLAAEGFSDKEIAVKLQVSVRTVEGHLYRSYGKLGISTRSELSLMILE